MTARTAELTPVSALDEAAMFVVFASRIYRSGQQCLCPLFHAASLCDAQEAFLDLQEAICADSRGGFMAGERGAPTVNRHEALLLGALSHWQRFPGDLSDHAFELLLAPAVSRIAAPLAREFARRMVGARLQLRMDLPEIEIGPHWHASPDVTAMN